MIIKHIELAKIEKINCRIAYNYTMVYQTGELHIELTDPPLPLRSNVLTEVQDTAASTSATPFA